MSKKILPPSKPGQSIQWVDKIIEKFSSKLEGCDFVIVCCRGYYLTSMGDPKRNDRGIYDDAFFLRNKKTGLFVPFNGNADPSVFRLKVASVESDQVVWHKKGKHGISGPNPYWALRQSRPVVVKRDNGKGGYTYDKPGWPWTNIHRGTATGTSSLGCLTVPPKQWDAFRELAYAQLIASGQTEVPTILVEVQG